MRGNGRSAGLVVAACAAVLAAACADNAKQGGLGSAGSGLQNGDGGEQAGGQPSGSTCGGIAGLRCAAGLFCNYEESAGGLGCDGSVADASGVCQPVPETCGSQSQLVCGCDRRSYEDPCAAHKAGVSVLREDLCTELDCEAIGGRVTPGLGPPPRCEDGEADYGYIRNSNGAMSIEGAKCCVGG